MLVSDLGLDKRLERKITSDGVITTVEQVIVLNPLALVQVWKLTDVQMQSLSAALVDKGYPPLDGWTPRARPEKRATTCDVNLALADESLTSMTLCGLPRAKGKRKCMWHWLLSRPVEEQIMVIEARAVATKATPGFVERPRVPKAEWPAGGRWCSECQTFVPDFYTLGSKCYAHGSRAAHASMTQRVYSLSREDYEALLQLQGGRCYICRQLPRKKRLAVDHDHRTGAVRGLLCANDEFGCNMSLRRLLNDVEMAKRALDYVEQPPMARLLAQRGTLTPAEPERVLVSVGAAEAPSDWPEWAR